MCPRDYIAFRTLLLWGLLFERRRSSRAVVNGTIV